MYYCEEVEILASIVRNIPIKTIGEDCFASSCRLTPFEKQEKPDHSYLYSNKTFNWHKKCC